MGAETLKRVYRKGLRHLPLPEIGDPWLPG